MHASLSFQRSRLLVLVILAVPLLACSISSLIGEVAAEPTRTPTAAAVVNIVTNAVTAKDAQGSNFDPVGITDAFPGSQNVYHAVVTITNAPTNTAIKVVWLDAAGGEMGNYELKSEGSRNLDFTFKPNAGNLPPGKYKAEVYVNGKLDRTLNFAVAADQAGPATVPPSTKAAPATVAPSTKPAPATTAPLSPSRLIASVTMATGVQGDNKDPVNPSTVFAANAVFHAVVAVKDAPANTKFTATWYVTDVGSAAAPNTLIDSTDLTTSGTRNLDFTLTPNNAWPAGTYRVEIAVNGTSSHVVNFSVSASSQPAQPTTAPPRATAAPSAGSGVISAVTMAEDTKGDNFDPVNPTIVFKPAATFHAVVSTVNAPANTKIKATWYVTDVGSAAAPNTLIDSYELTTDGTRNLDFTLSPKTNWPAGKYRVEIQLNGTPARVVDFTVQ